MNVYMPSWGNSTQFFQEEEKKTLSFECLLQAERIVEEKSITIRGEDHCQQIPCLKKQILKAATGLSGVAFLFGSTYKTPLLELVKQFDKVILFNFNAEEFEQARQDLDPDLYSRLSFVQMDLSGCLVDFSREIIHTTSNQETLEKQLFNFFLTPTFTQENLPNIKADFVISTELLNPYFSSFKDFLEMLFEENFGKLESDKFLEKLNSREWTEFNKKLIDHYIQTIESCKKTGGVTSLSYLAEMIPAKTQRSLKKQLVVPLESTLKIDEIYRKNPVCSAKWRQNPIVQTEYSGRSYDSCLSLHDLGKLPEEDTVNTFKRSVSLSCASLLNEPSHEMVSLFKSLAWKTL